MDLSGTILQTQDIHKSYEQLDEHPLEVLKGIQLSIPTGEFLCIVGPSGAGKSTLLHILGGLDRPNKGTVSLDGQDLYRLNDVQRAKVRNEKIGFVFQFYHLMPEFSALENVFLPAMVADRHRTATQLEEEGMGVLTQVGLGKRPKHKPNQLSGGEQQRVAIARALINRPKVILCDEPTGNLDSQSGHEIIDILMDLNQKNKQTVVVITHDESIAERAHRVVHIRDGVLTDA